MADLTATSGAAQIPTATFSLRSPYGRRAVGLSVAGMELEQTETVFFRPETVDKASRRQ